MIMASCIPYVERLIFFEIRRIDHLGLGFVRYAVMERGGGISRLTLGGFGVGGVQER